MAGSAYTSVSRYAILTKELTWGNFDDSSSDQVYPILVGDDGLTMTQNPGQNILETNTGHGRPFYFNGGVNEVTGSFNTIIEETFGKTLIEWGSTLNSNDLDSYSIDIGGGLLPGGYRWLGNKVASMTLTSGADAGAQRLAASFTLQGKSYTSTLDPVIAAEDFGDYSAATGYMHHQGTCTVGSGSGAANATVRDMSMTFTNNLDIGVGTGITPQWCLFTGRTVTCDLTLLYETDDLLDAFQSANQNTVEKCTLNMAYNNGTLTLTLKMNANVVINNFEVQESLGSRALVNASFTALIDEATAGDDDFEVTEASS
tara:strand:- start:2327 stop:3271 length:945 start_codon:yes stop_codon:yes gene_type:complete